MTIALAIVAGIYVLGCLTVAGALTRDDKQPFGEPWSYVFAWPWYAAIVVASIWSDR